MTSEDMARPDGPSSHAAHQAQGLGPSGFDPSREEEWRGTKSQREVLRAKFDGRCAYCGGELGRSMHADHLKPVTRVRPSPWNDLTTVKLMRPERNSVSNMMPACASCNMHKGGYSLEQWRDILERSAAILRRDTSTFRAGERFGIIVVDERPVQFYFEKIAGKCRTCNDGDWYPMYGVAPHECYWRKGPEFTLGQSTLSLITPEHCFVPDLEDDEDWSAFAYPAACGTYYCPDCQRQQYRLAWDRLVSRIGIPPPAIATEAEGRDGVGGSVHEGAGSEGTSP